MKVIFTKQHTEQKFHKNGKLWMEIPYVNDRIHGNVLEYYPNGQLQSIIPFTEGRPHGVAKKFSTEGELIHQICWFTGDIKEIYLVERENSVDFVQYSLN